MRSQNSQSRRSSGRSSWRERLRVFVPIFVFIALGITGMVAVYIFFGPAETTADVVAEAADDPGLTMPFQKPVPAKPVVQRLKQSPGPIRVALISGHMGADSGAVCEDGLTEAEVNKNITDLTASKLREHGIDTLVLEEYDSRLGGLTTATLISIHADSCEFSTFGATGFKIAGSPYTDSTTLSVCLEQEYRESTDLAFHADTITDDMRDYHAFSKISSGVPAAIIETGFMHLDQEILTHGADSVATGISDGILCFLQRPQSGSDLNEETVQ